MRTSIAMATFNGERFLPAQLDSFLAQQRLPDELIVSDDGSTDRTLAIVREFARTAPFPTTLLWDGQRRGYSSNFARAIAACTGDLLLLSDQDDVWLHSKISQLLDVFAEDPEAMVVINDQALTDAKLVATGQTIFGNTEALGFPVEWLSAGCCTSMRRQFVPLLFPFPAQDIAYDSWIHRMACTLGVRREYDQVLQLYRRHPGNASASLAAKSGTVTPLDELRRYGLRDASQGWQRENKARQMLVTRLQERASLLHSLDLDGAANIAIREQQHTASLLDTRARIVAKPRTRRPAPALAFWWAGGYEPFRGWKSLMKDLLR